MMITEKDLRYWGFECVHSGHKREWVVATETELPREERDKARDRYLGGGVPIPREGESIDREFEFNGRKFRIFPYPDTDNPTFETFVSVTSQFLSKDDVIFANALFDESNKLRHIRFSFGWNSIRSWDCEDPTKMTMPELVDKAMGALVEAMEDFQKIEMGKIEKERKKMEKGMNRFGEMLGALRNNGNGI